MVGGGISGLAAAWKLVDAGFRVTVLEAGRSLGGKLAQGEVAGIRVDTGAESMLNRRPEATALARRAGLSDVLVYPATITAGLWSRNHLRPMPRTMMGVPIDDLALAESGVLSEAGLARARADSLLPATDLGDGDVSVGWLVEERFGREVVDRLVEPLLGGVYAGHADNLSARATVPQVVALFDRDASMTTATKQVAAPAAEPVFAGLVRGLGQLPGAVAAASGCDVRLGATARELRRRPDGAWDVVFGSRADREVVHADALVLATPGRATARLLGDLAPSASAELSRIDYASMAVITLAFRRRDFPSTSGSGFLVPPVDGHAVKAVTYSFAKWEWVEQAGRGRADGEDVLVMRCSIGRHQEERVLQVDDAGLVEVALAELGAAIKLRARPVDWLVTRWGGGLPQYAVGHLDLVARVRDDVARLPGIAVCGAAYDGLGIPACIASAERAVNQVLTAFPG